MEISDRQRRREAVTTFHKNVVVTAGAGTGKTALLTARALVYLLGESFLRTPTLSPEQRAEEILALTFTEKAAAEMGERMVAFLRDLRAASVPPPGPVGDLVVDPLVEVYRLTLPEIQQRAQAFLPLVDRMDIGTIHSFCASLLRRFPFEAGVAVDFQVDPDETLVWQVVDEVWARYARDRLASPSSIEAAWFTVVEADLGMGHLRDLVGQAVLCPVPTELLLDPAAFVGDPEAARHQAHDALPSVRRIRSVVNQMDLPKNMRLPGLVDVMEDVAASLAGGGPVPKETKREWHHLASSTSNLCTKTVHAALQDLGIPLESFQALLAQTVSTLSPLVAFTPRQLSAVHAVVSEPIRECRAVLAREGILPFAHLLLYAAQLLKAHPSVAQTLRRRYRCILLDEVQDTDPLQYEILRAFCSDDPHGWAGSHTFMVGDPKQSIYLFRDADVGSFMREAQSMASQGTHVVIEANFRSDPRIIEVVNALGHTLFDDLPQGTGPRIPYAPLQAALPARGGPPVEFVVLDVPPKARQDERAQAERGALLAHLARLHSQGYPWGQVAILVPTRTGVDELYATLVASGIPVVRSGDRLFYSCQEVMDTAHLVASLADPWDHGALMAFLTSPVAGLKNEEVAALARAGLGTQFSYLDVASCATPHPCLDGIEPARRAGVLEVFASLASLHRTLATRGLAEALRRLTTTLPVVEAWGWATNGRQRMANVEKILREIGARVESGTSLGVVLGELIRGRGLQREGEEALLASPQADAVTIETVHGAKGLEFPVVVLANLFREPRGEKEEPVYVARDFATGKLAVRIGELRNQWARTYVERREREREAERRRLLYVALTRARERLVVYLTPGPKGCYSELISRALHRALERSALVPDHHFVCIHSPALESVASGTTRPCPPLAPALERLERRHELSARLEASPARITPSRDEPSPPWQEAVDEPSQSRERALIFGDLCHTILQHVDFARCSAHLELLLTSPLAQRMCQGDTALLREVGEVLRAALQSPFFTEELPAADLVLRELPFLDWVDGVLVSGRIDLAFRRGHSWTIVDYKTDRQIPPVEVLVERYGGQRDAYVRALTRALGLSTSPRFVLFFLRQRQMVELDGR